MVDDGILTHPTWGIFRLECISTFWRTSYLCLCYLFYALKSGFTLKTCSYGVVIFSLCLIGIMFSTSTARLTAKNQYLVGNIADLNQFLDIAKMDCQCLSTNPFWCCLYGGDASILIFSLSKYFSTSPDISLLSKSVLISFGLILQFILNLLIASSNDVVRFFRPYTNLNRVHLSTRSNMYLPPPNGSARAMANVHVPYIGVRWWWG